MAIANKTLEVKVRNWTEKTQERPDQKGISRVLMNRDVLLDLRLESGQPCYLWKVDEPFETRKEAIAWLAPEKLNKTIIQFSKSFQEFCGYKLAESVNISATPLGSLAIAESIVLREVTSQEFEDIPKLGEDALHWEWYLREMLGRAETIFPGMVFRNVLLRGPKRSFLVETVNGFTSGQAKYEDRSCSSVKMYSPDEISSQSLLEQPQSRLRVVDIAGIDQALNKLNRFLGNFDREFKYNQARRSCAVLLHGTHGTGKTLILNKIINSGWGKVYRIESDVKPAEVRTVFADARRSQPSIIIMDDFEDLVSKEDSLSQKITKVIGEELDNLVDICPTNSLSRVLVAAATNDFSRIPMSLRKRGRFKTEIALPIPDATARKSILKSLAPQIPLDVRDDVLNKLGERTHAYTAEDLLSLLDAAYEIAEERSDGVGHEAAEQNYFLEQNDIEKALLIVRPTAMHDITLRPPSVKWDEIGGQESVKKALRNAVERPLLHPDRIKRLGASAKKGLLLYGPPGCSKTLSAQAMATEAGFNFFAVKGAELLNMYVGESERAIRAIFARARAASPSIIFFDEIESIGSKRGNGAKNNGVNVLTTLLNEMDGIETLKGVTVLAATNQPQALDLALLRPGRFDKLLYVAPPDLAGREEILRVHQRKMDMAQDVNISELARVTDGYSGAEVVAICQEACDRALEKCEQTGLEEKLHMEDFLHAIPLVKKQITPELIDGYERWAAGIRGHAS